MNNKFRKEVKKLQEPLVEFDIPKNQTGQIGRGVIGSSNRAPNVSDLESIRSKLGIPEAGAPRRTTTLRGERYTIAIYTEEGNPKLYLNRSGQDTSLPAEVQNLLRAPHAEASAMALAIVDDELFSKSGKGFIVVDRDPCQLFCLRAVQNEQLIASQIPFGSEIVGQIPELANKRNLTTVDIRYLDRGEGGIVVGEKYLVIKKGSDGIWRKINGN